MSWIILSKRSQDGPPQVFRPTRSETFPTKAAADARISALEAAFARATATILYAFGSDD